MRYATFDYMRWYNAKETCAVAYVPESIDAPTTDRLGRFLVFRSLNIFIIFETFTCRIHAYWVTLTIHFLPSFILDLDRFKLAIRFGATEFHNAMYTTSTSGVTE
jgi:hypothetical protein